MQTRKIFHKNVLIEKYTIGMTRLVMVKKCSKKTFWYVKYIGQTFLVRDFKDVDDCRKTLLVGYMSKSEVEVLTKNYFLVLRDRTIRKIDCEVIK